MNILSRGASRMRAGKGIWIMRQGILGHFRSLWGIFRANGLVKDTFLLEGRRCVPPQDVRLLPMWTLFFQKRKGLVDLNRSNYESVSFLNVSLLNKIPCLNKLVPSVCLLVVHRLDNIVCESRSTIPCEGGWCLNVDWGQLIKFQIVIPLLDRLTAPKLNALSENIRLAIIYVSPFSLRITAA